MSRTRRFVRGVGVGYINQALVTLVGLWLVRFLLDRLGQEQYGLWLVAGQILGYLALLDLGVVALLPRETAYATGRAGDEESVSEVVARTWRLVLWQTPVVAVAALALWFWFPAPWEPLREPLGLVLLAFTLTFPLRVFEATLRGLQDFAFRGTIQAVSWFSNTATVVVLVFAGLGLYALAVGWVVGQVVQAAAAWLRLRSRFPDVLPARLPALRRATALRQLGRGLWVGTSQVAHVLFSATDVILIGAILSPAAAVPYVITGKLIGVLANYPQLLLEVAQPGLSQLKTAESRDRVLQASRTLAEGTLIFSGALVCIVLAVNEGFIGWWVGEAQWGGLALTSLILARIVLVHWTLSYETALFSFGFERRLAITALVNGLLVLGLSAALIPRVGVIGAPIGAIVGLCLVTIPAHLRALARETGSTPLRLAATTGHWIWRFGLMLGVGAGAALLGPFGFVGFLLVAVIVAGSYALLMVSRFVTPPLSLYLHPRLAAALAGLPGLFKPRPTS